jgi:hypothetical protein
MLYTCSYELANNGDKQMATKIEFFSVSAYEIEAGVFTVCAKGIDGTWFYHEGPRPFPYFTEKQANALVWKVRGAGQINEQHWINDAGGHYGTDGYEMALIEAEYWAA